MAFSFGSIEKSFFKCHHGRRFPQPAFFRDANITYTDPGHTSFPGQRILPNFSNANVIVRSNVFLNAVQEWLPCPQRSRMQCLPPLFSRKSSFIWHSISAYSPVASLRVHTKYCVYYKSSLIFSGISMYIEIPYAFKISAVPCLTRTVLFISGINDRDSMSLQNKRRAIARPSPPLFPLPHTMSTSVRSHILSAALPQMLLQRAPSKSRHIKCKWYLHHIFAFPGCLQDIS